MILLRLVLFVDVLIKAKLKGFQVRLHPMMWTELLTKRELQSTKKIGWCNIYTATLRAVFKKISKVHSLSLPICHVRLTITENKVHHCTQGKRTWKVWFPFRSLTLSFSLLIWNKPFFLSLGTTMYCWRNWPDCYYREISWSKWEAVFYSAGHEGGKIFVHINVHECTGKI